MYLKSIEIHGFKSFANRIRFEFPDGITGIVGPNGSGKSNVADAMRWVLGEQKIKQLRGNRMEDVIFAGTASRKPQSFAFVAITLDNSDKKLKLDFDEITVSRRVFRSGESEYMINGSVCRLRDVQELFYDTGIGKEGYSIIGQGQIDKILQGKPEERRELFDEAAGIVKYKKRKTIALRKLENERLSMSRAGDIISELSRQVGPLKKQSEAASKFIELSSQLKTYDINLFLIENGTIKTKIRDYEEKERIASEDLERTQRSLEDLKAEYESLSLRMSELDARTESVRNRIARCNIVKEGMLGQINVLKEQINSANEAKSHYKERVQLVSDAIERTKTEKESLIAGRSANQRELTDVIASQNAEDSALIEIRERCDGISEETDILKESLVGLIGQRGQINSRIERLNALTEQLSARKSELESDLIKYASDKDSQAQTIARLEAEYNDAQADAQKISDSLDGKTKELSDCERRILSLQQDLDRYKERLAVSSSRLESVKNITERYEGYGNTVREVMKLKDSNRGIRGVVADIIRTEKKYEVAIETALGGSIQNIVTDTESTARDIIEYLKKNRLGRATFLPIKAVTGKGEFRNTDALEEKGVLGLASSLVDVDEEYRAVADYLLGKIVVCDGINNALAIARKYRYSLIIVTLEGELLNRGGSITGGAYKNKSNLLGRRREIEELEKAVEDCKNGRENALKMIASESERRDGLKGDVAELTDTLQESRIFISTLKVNLEQASIKSREISQGFDSVENERKTIEEQVGTMSAENTSLSEELGENLRKESETKERITALEAALCEARNSEAAQMIVCQSLKAENVRLSEQNSNISASIEKCSSDLERLEGELADIIRNNTGNDQSIGEKLREIEETEAAVEKAGSEAQTLAAELGSLEQTREEQSSSHKDFIDRREMLASRCAELDKEIFRLTQLREKEEERFESRSAYIWEEYELTYQGALELRDDELNDVKALQSYISELKSSIRSLGTINVSAIEEYKEVKERYEFLTTQYEDLKKAEADLVRIIRDLDREMRKQFKSEFARITAEFAKVFKELFGGGYGTIELEEDADILDAGISIIAQPPGKKLQNMMQLSGGEKALTAIAVLFAIQNLKPSPFCLLDEIEAALDDSNIGRFAGYLHRLSHQVQFIVITHRKGTMEAADRLYGITMQEKGVSTLISVNLEDFKEEA